MSLPFVQSYTDAKRQKAYERYLSGHSQRKIAAALKIPPRTVADWSKKDGWELERKARAAAADSPNVAAVAAETPNLQQSAATPPADGQPETRTAAMERVLGQQQYLAGLLTDALRQDIEGQVAAAKAVGKPLSRAQISQLTSLSNNLFTLERKAWGVPDKIETKDTTPHKPDPVRELTDEQLERELEAARRTRAAAGEGAAAKERVN